MIKSTTTAGLIAFAALAGITGTAYAAMNEGGGGADCPAWTSARCVRWTGTIGHQTCAEWQCVADKKSDPPKATMGGVSGNGGKVKVLGNLGTFQTLKKKSN